MLRFIQSRWRTWLGRRGPAFLLLVVLLAALAAAAHAVRPSVAAEPGARDLLRQALAHARAAGSYDLTIALDQAIAPVQNTGAAGRDEWSHFEIAAEIAGPDRMRFSMTPGRTSFTPANHDKQEFLIADGAAYQATGDKWASLPAAPSTLQMQGDALSLLETARAAHMLTPQDAPAALGGRAGAFRRVGFQVTAEDILRQSLAQAGPLTDEQMALARLGAPAVSGAGELWIDAAGYPARLILDLGWMQYDGATPYRAQFHSDATYAGFGRARGPAYPTTRFDPTASPATGVPQAAAVQQARLLSLLWLPAMALVLALLWLTRLARGGHRRAFQFLTALTLAVMLLPMVAQAANAAGLREVIAGQPAAAKPTVLPGSEVSRMLSDIRAFRQRQTTPLGTRPANAIDDLGDEDGDGLPNGYEVRYGTSPYSPDSDYDGLTDYQELYGVTCKDTQGSAHLIKTNPLNPDTNADGLLDGQEIHNGICAGTGSAYYGGYAWQDDNDSDSVPDALDLSPFSRGTEALGGAYPTPNLTFETLDQDAGSATVIYPFYVELQIRPNTTDSLRWAYKSVYWPYDDEAAVQRLTPAMVAQKLDQTNINLATSGKVSLIPFLQATVRELDLPTPAMMQAYGVAATPHKDPAGSQATENGQKLWDITIPLVTVERGGQAYAFQAKMLHDQRPGNNSLTRTWRDLRLKWAAIADVLMADADGKLQRSPASGYGLWVYDEAYYITGMQMQRQGGAAMLVAGALPSNQPYDDGPIALLRGGLEARYLTGGMTLGDIKTRFDTPNSATPEERWGMPQSMEFRVLYDASKSFKHLDEAIMMTTVTTTKQILAEFGQISSLKPTLLFAGEQRTSTVNLDDDPPTDWHNIDLNACLKPLVTSRTLKLQTYQQHTEPGDLLPTWEPLSLDEVLAKVENEYAASTPANYPYYNEELVIQKMATTSWQEGVTSIILVGQISAVDLGLIPTDPMLMATFLENGGLVPSGTKAVLDMLFEIGKAGGPAAWLDKMWNTVVDVWTGAQKVFAGSYMGLANQTPDAHIKVLPMGDQDNSGQPAVPDTPLDKQILGYTQAAMAVLNLLATLIGDEVFSQVVQFLSKLIDVFQKLSSLVSTIKMVADFATKAQSLGAAAGDLAKELNSVVQPLAVIGLLFTLATIWIGVLCQFGDLGPSMQLTVVLRAIVDTVIAVVLFAIALIFPYGTIVALAIGLIKAFESLIGFNFDPVSAFLDWLFGSDPEQRTDLNGDPNFGNLTMTPLDFGAGIISQARFRLELPATTYMKTMNEGTKKDLGQSGTELHVGRALDWPGGPASLCTPSMELFYKYKEAVGAYFVSEFHADNYNCVDYNLPTGGWGFDAQTKVTKGTPTQPYGEEWYRTDQLKGWVDVTPYAGINSLVPLDVMMDVTIRYDMCSTVGGCDEYTNWSESPPSITGLYFDILPGSLEYLWGWDELKNLDPDGDGLIGYLPKDAENPMGLDANLCPGKPGAPTWQTWDSDSDGLSDYYEYTTAGFDPCQADTDGDGLNDYPEMLLGTAPDKTDTDGDGLTDYQEVPRLDIAGVNPAWRVHLATDYPGLADPPAYPNPRQANADRDYRNDTAEKAAFSSPTSFNPIPVGAPMPLAINQQIAADGSQSIRITSLPFENQNAAALHARLVMTVPVQLNNATATNGRLLPLVKTPGFNDGTRNNSHSPKVYSWSLPDISAGRWLEATVTGRAPAGTPAGQAIQASLAYDEAGVHQVSTQSQNLFVDAGGPVVTFTSVTGATPLSGFALPSAAEQVAGSDPSLPALAPEFLAAAGAKVTLTGAASDTDRVLHVYVCAKLADNCGSGDWQIAQSASKTPSTFQSMSEWFYTFTASADGIYHARAYATDAYGLAGDQAGPVTFGVDGTPPAAPTLELPDVAYVRTVPWPGVGAGVPISGQVTDAGSGYVSGAGFASFVTVRGTEGRSVAVRTPGAATSPFTLVWTPPNRGDGSAVRTATGFYQISVNAADLAGNASPVSHTLQLVVDDTPPAVYGMPPQVLQGTALALSGLADDTARVSSRGPARPLASLKTTSNAGTQITTGAADHAVIVGDVNGDQIDDVVLYAPAAAGLVVAPFHAGLFFGKPGGLPASLSMADADVRFNGEIPVTVNGLAAVAGLGDLNGDGVGDLLFGDPATNSGAGRAYVVLGRRSGWTSPYNLANADWRFSVTSTTGFGGSVAAAGDVNGDGLADFLVGASTVGAQNGGAWLYLGREQGAPTVPRTAFTPPNIAIAAPPGLAGMGDVDGDGFDDFIIAFRGATAALVTGRVTSVWPSRTAFALATGAAVLLDGSGAVLNPARVGDVNGDGLADLLLGAPGSEVQYVYLLYGRRPGTPWPAATVLLNTQSDASFRNVGVGSRLGTAVAGLGDVDSDGRADFAFGQPGNGAGPNRIGLVLSHDLVNARNQPVTAASQLVTGTANSQTFGDLLSSGDVSGDHIRDLLVGASGASRAYLFYGAFNPGGVAGIAQVELGLYGPVTDPTLPVTVTLPVSWQIASLTGTNAAITAWRGQVTAAVPGDYRVYARATDRAGNVSRPANWYLGNTWVSASLPHPFASGSVTMNAPVLLNKNQLTLDGTVTSAPTAEAFRVFDGTRWRRLSPADTPWSLTGDVPNTDLRVLAFNAVARDAYGTTQQTTRTLSIDNFVAAPTLTANLPMGEWRTDLAASLVVTWPNPTDLSGSAGVWAAIDTAPDTTPATPAVGNQVAANLTPAGAFYAHVRVRDGAGNEASSRIGPFLVNHHLTPSALLADGYLDQDGGEFPDGTLLNYDPFSAQPPAALFGTWDASHLYLAFTGRAWDAQNRLAFYLDTQAGGIQTTLPPSATQAAGIQTTRSLNATHTLPFAADFAVALGGPDNPDFALYTAAGGAWSKLPAPHSFARVGNGTEIVLHRNEIAATGGLSLLGIAEDPQGAWAVLPASARPVTDTHVAGPMTLAAAMSWPGLGDGIVPNAGLEQALAPIVTVTPAWGQVVQVGGTAPVSLRIANPGIAAYDGVPLTVDVGTGMTLQSLDGGRCQSCPPGAHQWTLLADVAAGGMQTITIQMKALDHSGTGVFPLDITASLAHSGVPARPQAPARSRYLLDKGTVTVKPLKQQSSVYAQPGAYGIGVMLDSGDSVIARCLGQVEVNTGSGWTPACPLGNCNLVFGTIGVGASQNLQVRTTGSNGQSSPPATLRVVADGVAPTSTLSVTAALSGTLAWLGGTAADAFPATQRPTRVEVSIDGGQFRPAMLPGRGATLSLATGAAAATGPALAPETASATTWRLPLHLTTEDGKTIHVVVRAVDEAGNVGATSAPMTIVLDNLGPRMTAAVAGGALQGAVTDGSGVRSVELSLDGGLRYEKATVADNRWRYDLGSWSGSRTMLALIRATDTHGNATHAALSLEGANKTYLPLVLRQP